MSGSGRESHPEVREWLGVTPICLEVVGTPLQMSRSGRETLLDVQEWL